jgi:nitrite reductase/ring-hydroxylating ferredoxin subunit
MSTPDDSESTEKHENGDTGRYFKYMAEFVGFGAADAQAIHESGLVIEKYLPAIIGHFYTNLLQYPPTRKFFLKRDGTVDDDYLQLRMYHQANFWRRTAGGVYDDDYARYVDYVGRAHTSRGADPRVYIAERYVIGMVGFIQYAITDALLRELHDFDPELESRAVKAWNKLCMVILEMLARAYGHEREAETFDELLVVDPRAILDMSIESYEKGLGIRRPVDHKAVPIAPVEEIPDGERKMVQIDGLSVGVFHHKGGWYALRNSCLHRGGPVATGKLVDDRIICPWHGYTYEVSTGRLVTDPSARLDTYPVSIEGGWVYVQVPIPAEEESLEDGDTGGAVAERDIGAESAPLKENEFPVGTLPEGGIRLVHLNGQRVAVYNVDGVFYATQEECTHAGGPLSEGELEGSVITCPWHGSCFDVRDGSIQCRPATRPLKTYAVSIDGEIGRVETAGG